MIYNPEQTARALSIINAINPDYDSVNEEMREYIDAANTPDRDAELKQIISDYIGVPI